MADDVSLGEVVRVIEQLRKDIGQDFAEVRREISDDRTRFVSSERYEAEAAAQNSEIARIDARFYGATKWAMGILATIIGLQLWQWLQLKQAVKP